MSRFLRTLHKQVLLGDGAMGTMLQELGLPPGDSPELWGLSHPAEVKSVHEAYFTAGSQVIQTNTFGANAIKLQEYDSSHLVKEININSVRLVREVVGDKAFIAGIIGPCGYFPAPLGQYTWSELVHIFAEQAQALAEGGADFIFLETFSDLGEIRAALYAVKNYTSLPAACSLTYNNGRTLTGSSPETAAIVLSALGADLIGANCSTGPQELLEVIKEYRQATNLPLLVEPNAGMPELIEGKTVYRETPENMASFVELFRQEGVNLIGACCGSTPEHIRAMNNGFVSRQTQPANRYFSTRLASRSRTVRLGSTEYPCLIGERLNPSARKIIAEALREENWQLLSREGLAQIEAGSTILDFNVGVPGLDEGKLLAEGVRQLQMSLDIPLVLDCTDPAALEAGLREYQGKALINSVNGEEKSLHTILPLAKKYGAAVLGLTLDERGIPETAEERLEIAKKIVLTVETYGIPREDVMIDCLVLTAASSPALVKETIRAIELVKEHLGTATVLGLSNVSHGLPQRSWLNNTFLALTLNAGLDAAIANPLDNRIIETLVSAALLSERDPHAKQYLLKAGKTSTVVQTQDKEEPLSLQTLQKYILQGQQEPLEALLQKLLEHQDVMTIINQGIIPPLENIGNKFASGEAYLPQLMQSGDAAKIAFDFLKERLPEKARSDKGTIVLGTVKGDVHDIGKNIFSALLENHGYAVIDLGKNVPAQDFINAARDKNANIIGLSALMTTTMTEMAPLIQQARKELPNIKIIVGGAVVTPDYAKQIDADGYGKDAVEGVRVVQNLLEKRD